MTLTRQGEVRGVVTHMAAAPEAMVVVAGMAVAAARPMSVVMTGDTAATMTGPFIDIEGGGAMITMASSFFVCF